MVEGADEEKRWMGHRALYAVFLFRFFLGYLMTVGLREKRGSAELRMECGNGNRAREVCGILNIATCMLLSDRRAVQLERVEVRDGRRR